MRYYVSCLGPKYLKIKTDGSGNLMGGDFHYPIISAIEKNDNSDALLIMICPNSDHLKNINSNDTNNEASSSTNSNNTALLEAITEIGANGYKGKVLNVIANGSEDSMCELFDIICNTVNENDNLVVDISCADRIIGFAMTFAAKYLKDVKNVNSRVICTKADTCYVQDVSNEYLEGSLITQVKNTFDKYGII